MEDAHRPYRGFPPIETRNNIERQRLLPIGCEQQRVPG
ncbi:hypothetical protein chiPu_0029971, partial [Chiloscyllium punctatum]|nr:hypothetical protein [Chiloscyllium punctatum]